MSKHDSNGRPLQVDDEVEFSVAQHPYTMREMVGTRARVVSLGRPESGKVGVLFLFRGLRHVTSTPTNLLTLVSR